MLIFVGADHAGFELKEKLKKYLASKGENIVDVGAFEIDEKDDFSKYANLLADCFEKNKNARLIACCGSGVGMSIALNKKKHICACVGHGAKEVKLARAHNNINALCLGGRTTCFLTAKRMTKAFLTTDFLGGKYQKRMKDIEIKN